MREAARILQVSSRTLYQWEKDKLINRGHPHKKLDITELIQFLHWLEKKAKAPPARDTRFKSNKYPFQILCDAKFSWQLKEKSLTPTEIALRVGCHPSTIIKAIRQGYLQSFSPTPYRYAIKRNQWLRSFYGTIVKPIKKRPLK